MKIARTLLKLVLGLAIPLVLAVAALALTARARPPAQAFELKPATGTAADTRPVLVFGASGGAGYEIVKLLRGRGVPVTAAVRPTSDRSRLGSLGVQFVVADALDAGQVRAAATAANFRAVISTVGCLRCKPPPDFIGNRNIIDAARDAGIRRVILISTVGAGDSYEAINMVSRIVLAPVLPLKTRAEDHLRTSGLDYTIIRPGGLRAESRASTGRGGLSEDRMAFGFIHRADLARLVVDALDDDRTIGRTFVATDPGVALPWL